MEKDLEIVKQKIETFMNETFLVKLDENINIETDLFVTGIINSYGYMQIINYLQDEFEIEMTNDELFSNVLSTFSSMITFVEEKKKGKQRA
ncbi:MAG: hypothetical protein KKE44_07840 [Proteobacteria bacterium]|nr:hypothetical protein [Pseudomonadota bacterium]MBU1582638.1 hypothetical protein [Pseudomonadota bacterium]MBU2453215.1 hypothetical protein [Pseudomonadota bacterium]MBU2629165.1 hypothetical protein [Pseudomonadota bacterium]